MRIINVLRQGFSKIVSNQLKNAFDDPSFAKLSKRNFIIVFGPDAKNLLQGITTNNISQLYTASLKNKDKKIAIYSLFLDPKGKVITDAIIIRPIVFTGGKKILAQNELWIDVANQVNTSLYEHLRKYTWKKKVQLNNLMHQTQKPDILAGFNKKIPQQLDNSQQIKSKAGLLVDISSSQSSKDENVQDGSYANIAYYDPRDAKFGIRIVCSNQGFKYDGKYNKQTQQQYQKVCRMHGTSSTSAMVNKLPFMFNSDLFNGFSFNKGCYLGQQIIARAYHTGIVRRRVFPFVLQDKTKKIQPGTVLLGQNNLQIGKVLESYNGHGTILCSYLSFLDKKWPIQFKQPFSGTVKMPFQAQLFKYLQDMKKKQAKLDQIDL